MASKKAWVTLATNDTYSLGALVLAHSLKKVNTEHEFVVLITCGVTYAMRGALKSIFDVVQEVNVLDSSDVENLQLLARPELGITFTKLHCWRLTQYEKCVFLDADTLVLQNCDELFDREELSAAPDVGWPDCFNSGVFVYKPSEETYQKLIKFALDHGSFDGADQGLLNMFFSDWATNDGSKRLSFLYNLTSAAIYSYLPAFKWFGKGVKIMHFIGNAKPWLQPFNSETRTVSSDSTCSHLINFLQYWWDLFFESVHPQLSPEMTRLLLRFWFTPEKRIIYNPPRQYISRVDSKYIFNDFIRLDEENIASTEKYFQFTDPWEEFENIAEYTKSHDQVCDNESSNQYTEVKHEIVNLPVHADIVHEVQQINYHRDSDKIYLDPSITSHLDSCTDGIHCGTPAVSICGDQICRPFSPETSFIDCEPKHEVQITSHSTDFHSAENNKDSHSNEYFSPRFVFVNYLNEVVFGDNEITHDISENKNYTENDAGLANSLSQMKLEEPSPEQKVREDLLRRQEWEHGNIDYMGRDAFENILNKINQTLLEQTKTESVNVDTTSSVSQDSYTKTSESISDLQEKSTTLISEDFSPSSTIPAAVASPAVPDVTPEQSIHKVKDPASITIEKAVSVKKPLGGKSVAEKSISSSQSAVTEQSNTDEITEPPLSSQKAAETPSTKRQTLVESSVFCPISTPKSQNQSPTPVTESPVAFIKPSPISQKQTSAESPVSCPAKKEDYPLSPAAGMSATLSKSAPVAQEQMSVESPACPKPTSEKLGTSSSSTSAEITLLKQEQSKGTTKTQASAGSTTQSSAKRETSQKVALSRQSSGQENQGKSAQKSGGGKKK